MPWRLKKTVYLILLGAIALALTIVVFIRTRNSNIDLLAVVGLIGGLAIIINALPTNSGDKEKPDGE